MTQGKATPVEVRARAKAMLISGSPQGAVADATGLSRTAVSRLARSPELAADLAKLGTDAAESEFDLLRRYFRLGLQALIAQVIVSADEAYLRQQPAAGVAVLHGQVWDRVAVLAPTLERVGVLVFPERPAAAPPPGFESDSDPPPRRVDVPALPDPRTIRHYIQSADRENLNLAGFEHVCNSLCQPPKDQRS